MQLKSKFLAFASSVIFSSAVFAQSDAEKINVLVGGTFGKPKIMPSLSKLAIAQYTVNYKLTTTESVIGKEKSTGSIAGAKMAAFLETTDGELGKEDFQEITDYGYAYFQKQLQASGIGTVDWTAISNHDFFKAADGKDDDDKKEKGGNIWMTASANNGNIIYGGKTAFAFGKIKKATKFSEDLGAPVAYFNLVVDFADIALNVTINTKRESGNYVMAGYPVKKSKSFKYEGNVTPEMHVSPSEFGKMSLLWNEKTQAETITIGSPIFAAYPYNTSVSEDESRLKRGAFDFEKKLKPIVIETTKAKYKEAAKKALEKHADAFIAKAISMKKA